MAPRVVPRPTHERTAADNVKDVVALGVVAEVFGHGQSIWRKAAFMASAGMVRLGAHKGAKATAPEGGSIAAIRRPITYDSTGRRVSNPTQPGSPE